MGSTHQPKASNISRDVKWLTINQLPFTELETSYEFSKLVLALLHLSPSVTVIGHIITIDI